MPILKHRLSFCIGCGSTRGMKLLRLIAHAIALASFPLLAGAGVSDQSEAWVNARKNIVLEPKPGAWKAQWIDAGPEITSDSFGRVFYLRKTFVTQNPEAFRRVYVSADSKY